MGAVCTKKSNKPKKYTATQTTHLIPKDGVSPRIIDNSANSPLRESNLRMVPNSQVKEPELKSPLTSSKKPIEIPIIREFPPEDNPKLQELKKSEIFPIEMHDDNSKQFLSISIEPEKRKKEDQYKEEEQPKIEKELIFEKEFPKNESDKNIKNEDEFNYEAFLVRNIDYKKEDEEEYDAFKEYEQEEIKKFEFIQAVIQVDHNSFGGILEEEMDLDIFLKKAGFSEVKEIQPIIRLENDPYIFEEEIELDDYLNDFNMHEEEDNPGREMLKINEINEKNEFNDEKQNNIENNENISFEKEYNSNDLENRNSARNSEKSENSYSERKKENAHMADVKIDMQNISNNFFGQRTSDNLNDDMGFTPSLEERKSVEAIQNDNNLLNDEEFEFEIKKDNPQSNFKYSTSKSQDFRNTFKEFKQYERKVKLVEKKMKESLLLGHVFAYILK